MIDPKIRIKMKINKIGNWKILEELGNGGNGVVHKVQNENGEYGALKLLHKNHYKKPERIERFISEIKAMNSCQDIEGILKVLDYDIPSTPSTKSQIWFVSELAIPMQNKIDGYTLENLVEICVSYAKTLKKMHSRGIYHRDIKPDNLFFKDDKWFIGDFGLATFPDKPDLTKENEKLGPLFYMAPEMLLDAQNANGASADVWSLAKLIWKLGTFQNYPIEGTLRQDETSTQLSTYNNNPRAFLLEPILESATSLNPKDRITMEDFYLEIDSWLYPKTNDKKSNVTNVDSIKEKISGMFLKAE